MSESCQIVWVNLLHFQQDQKYSSLDFNCAGDQAWEVTDYMLDKKKDVIR